MSQNNLLQSYSWETQYEDAQVQFVRPIQDEVISVYEVYVKEETVGPDGRSEISVVSGVPGTNDHQLIQILEQRASASEDNVVVYSHPVVDGPSTTTARLIDKDDPRSRLHFVKYLKRDGKTLKVWECGICSKEFRHQYTLMRHLPTHTDERNFKCEACGKAFRQLSTLSQHKAIHSDARPYVCEFCKKTFNRVSTLISHRKTHSEHKPHKCHLCGKGFHQKGNLRNHVFTHTNERPYKCELCGKGFNQMSNLVCHKVKAHAHAEKMQYICGICGKEFPRRFSLRSHEEYKHGIKYRHSTGLQNTNESNVIRNKNVKIVHLPDGDRTPLTDIREKEILSAMEYMESVVIDKIETKAIENAIFQGQIPFALFKPVKGIPVLVKVSPMGNHKHVLTPATAEDLRMAGKITLSPNFNGDTNGVKAVQIKVPVVATVTQKVNPDGKFSFLIEPPGPEQEQESLVEPIESQFTYSEQIRTESEHQNETVHATTSEDCNELLELAALGGIQFVRATEDGRYEVMTNNEARDLMAQNSHDVTILDGEDADAINVVNIRGDSSDEVIIGDADSQIMVLNSGSSQKTMLMDDIEILEDKDIRILETKNADDRFTDGITFLSHSKLDDLILGSKSLSIDGGVAVMEQDEESIGTSQQNFTSILNNRSEVLTLSTTSQSTIMSLLNKDQPTISILNENLPYLKASQVLSEDMNILGIERSPMESTILDTSIGEYNSKLKLTEFNDGEPEMEMNSTIRSEMTILGLRNQNARNSGISEKIQQKAFTAFGDVKILGPKGQTPDVMSQHQEIKILGNYEQFIKNTSSSIHVSSSNVSQADPNERKGVKILGKKLETGILSTIGNGSLIQVLEEKTAKPVTPSASNLCSTSETSVIQDSPKKEKYPAEGSIEDFIFQACDSPDFLSLESRLPTRNVEKPF